MDDNAKQNMRKNMFLTFTVFDSQKEVSVELLLIIIIQCICNICNIRHSLAGKTSSNWSN